MEFFTNYKPDYAAYERELFANGVTIEAEWIRGDGCKVRIVRTVSRSLKVMIYRRNENHVFVIDYIGAYDMGTHVVGVYDRI